MSVEPVQLAFNKGMSQAQQHEQVAVESSAQAARAALEIVLLPHILFS